MKTFNNHPRIPKQGDLPVAHLGNEGHYVPPKTDDPELIAARKARPGTLKLLASSVGANVAAELVFSAAEDPEHIDFVSGIIAPSVLNTMWYQFAQGEAQNRRNLPYYPLYERLDPADTCMNNAAEHLQESAVRIKLLAGRVGASSAQLQPLRRNSSLSLRASAEALIAAPHADRLQADPERYSEYQVGQWLQQSTKSAIEKARTMRDVVGTYPSLAQLAEVDSDLSVFIRKNSPSDLRTKFRERQEEAIDLQPV